ncbi:MAG: DUF6429 family protein [Candidatus Methanomethylophilaceae archaeon]|jgi:hypothetical protein
MEAKIPVDDAIREMTLMLLYLTRFKEGKYDCYRSWKGYDFDTLDDLGEKELIHQGRHPSKSKSIVFTDEGSAKAEQLLEKYGIGNRCSHNGPK